MKIHVTRQLWRLRSWLVQGIEGGEVVDERRMFGGPLFAWRLRLKANLMRRRRDQIKEVTGGE